VPYINYALGKSSKVGSWDDINRFGYGIGLGAGVDVWRFQFNARYNWDFSKVGDEKKESRLPAKSGRLQREEVLNSL
jgi:hypothetical protein